MAQTQTTLAALKNPPAATASAEVIRAGFDTADGFALMQRAAMMFSKSMFVPPEYQGETGIGNCVIALDMAMRMGANPLLVMQNLYSIYNRPAWSAKFLIATLNQSGRFSALRYVFQGKPGEDAWGCKAVAIEKITGEQIEGPLITIDLAKKEGWYDKKGSKWKTMPEQMLRYRAATWFVNAYAPDLAMGLRTVEEEQDIVYDITPGGGYQVTTDEIRRGKPSPEPEPALEDPKQEKKVSAQNPQEDNPTVKCPNHDGKTRPVTDCDACSQEGCPVRA